MTSRITTKATAAIAGAAAVIVGAVTGAQEPELPAGQGDEFEIVDCLLPPQIRRLGANLTYTTPRRPARLAARDCLRRHGEYVAFDPANYRDAFALWLEQAETGDAEAQTYVAEFYEKGMGVPQNYAQAARWYAAAAEQDFSRAQLSLAYLYEQGLGVEQDLAAALNLYRRGTGIDNDDLVFESELVASRAESQRVIDNLTSQLEDQNAQVETLQSQLALTQQRLVQRRSDLDAVEAEVETLRSELDGLYASTAAGRQAEIDALEAELDARERELLRRLEDVAALESAGAEQRASLADQLQRASRQDAELKARLSEQTEEMLALRRQLAEAQDALYAAETREAALSATLASERVELASERGQVSELTEQQRLEVQAREQRIAEQQSEIERLRGERKRVLEEVVALQSRERELIAGRAEADQELASSRAQIASIEQRLLVTDQRVADLTAELERERERFRLERERLIERERLADASQAAETEHLRTELALREAELEQQESLIATLQAESRSYRNEIDQIESAAVFDLESTPRVAMRSAGPRLTQQTIEASRSFLRDAKLGNYYALVIGNGAYTDLEQLETATADARAISEVLTERYGFEVTTLLNATRTDILRALYSYIDEDSRNRLEEEDRLLIYYAGHGEIDPRGSNGYWLPVNATRSDRSQWISDQDITRVVAEMPAKHVLVVADSCYSGEMTRNSSVRLSSTDPEKQEELFKILAQLKSRTVLTSGAQQPVMSGGGEGHSVFARHLLDLLRSNDRVIDATTLYSSLYDGVRETAEQYGVEQTPQYLGIADAGHAQGDFLFVPIS